MAPIAHQHLYFPALNGCRPPDANETECPNRNSDFFGLDLVADEEQLGSKETLEAFVQPPPHLGHEITKGKWELALPSWLESVPQINAPLTMTPTKRRPTLSSADGTPIPPMKYLIRTPPRVASALASRSASPAIVPSSVHAISPFEAQTLTWIEEREWPSLEDFFVTVPEWANCSICSDLFDEPVQWPNCEHTFCKSCVTRLLTYGHRECPMCRGVLPNEIGFGDLQHAVRMSSALLLLPVRCRWGLAAIRSSRAHSISVGGDALEHSSSTISSSVNASQSARLHSEASHFTLSAHHGHSTPISSGLAASGSDNGGGASSFSFGGSLESSGGLSSSMSSVEHYLQHATRSRAEVTRWIPREDAQSCPEFVPLSSLREHMMTCPFAPARCLHAGCHQLFLRSEIEKHQSECAHRPVSCTSCAQTLAKSSLASHLLTCPEAAIACTCGDNMPRKLHQEHMRLDCPDSQLDCPFAPHGCAYRGKRAHINQHLQTCPYEAVKGYIARTEAKFDEFERNIERLESMILSLRSQIHTSITSSRNATLRSSSQHRQHPQSTSSGAQSSSSTNARPLGPAAAGSFGHGRRSGRFWDDYDDFEFSDDEFSIHL